MLCINGLHVSIIEPIIEKYQLCFMLATNLLQLCFMLATNLLQLCFMLATNLFVPDHLRISQKIVTKRVDLESDSIREKKKIFGVWTKK